VDCSTKGAGLTKNKYSATIEEPKLDSKIWFKNLSKEAILIFGFQFYKNCGSVWAFSHIYPNKFNINFLMLI